MSIRARGITVRYGPRLAVDGVTLDVAPGEVLAILGANGSGKSSLLRALAGVHPCGGELTCATPRRTIGFMPQDNTLRAALTAFEVVLLGRLRSLAFRVGEADLLAARAAMAELDIADLASRRMDEVSGGQRQLVFLAQVLAADPAVLLLDEPTSALDIAHQVQVLTLLRTITARRRLTTVAVLHDLNAAARFADRIALMHAGRLVAIGPPSAVLTRPVLRAAYGVDICIMTGPDGRPVVLPVLAAVGDRPRNDEHPSPPGR